ncbi:MAG: hypothetical protein JXR86_03540 [Spirochaetales bacterium]|nr:hypothetical protein [Spirochaetales bacterium]
MSDQQKKMISEINAILKKLDGESLSFIREQAGVLLYNKEVRERNARALKEENGKPKGKKKDSPIKNKAKSGPDVYFEQLKNGKFFNLCISGEKLFMDYKEIKILLNIARAAESPSDGALRLYNWFKRERKDVLVDAHLGRPSHPALLLIYRELLETFE